MKLSDLFPLLENYATAQQRFSIGENPDVVSDYLAKFKALHNRLSGENKDISYWEKQGWEKFQSFVDSIGNSKREDKGRNATSSKNSINIYEDDNWLAVVPLDKKASCFYGKNTQWCTASTGDRNYFERYFVATSVILIYLISKSTKEKYAVAYSRKDNHMECFNRRDDSITPSEFDEETGFQPSHLIDLAKKHQSKIESAREANNANVTNPDVIMSLIETGRSLSNKQLDVVKADPELAFSYAKRIGKRFPEGEAAIAEEPMASVIYAKDILHGKFEKGEPAIAKGAYTSLQYAENVLHARFPKGEASIAKDAMFSQLYAENVIHGRFPEGERAISKVPVRVREYNNFLKFAGINYRLNRGNNG